MQTAPQGTYSGMLHCAGGILKNEGPLAFYKVSILFLCQNASDLPVFRQGTVSPLVGIGACVSIQFGALESTKRYFTAQNLASGTGGADGRLLNSSQLVTAGVAAGLANSVVSGPVEHIRISTLLMTS